MAVSLKVLFIKTGKNAAEDIRRVTIPAAEAKTAPFDYLCAHIRNTNALDKAAPLTAKYKDEEDEWITVSSNVELSDAISTATPQRPLRLFVAPATADVNFAALPVPATPAGASTAQLTASPLSASTVSVLPAPAPAAAAPAPLSLPVTTPDAKAAIKAEPSPAPAPVAAAEKAAEAAPAAAPAAAPPAPSSVSSLAGKDEDDGFVHVAMNASILKPASPQAAAPAAAEPAKVDTPKVEAAAPAPAPEKVDTPKAEEVVAPAKAEPKASPVPAAEAPAPAVAAPTVTPVIAAVVAAEPTPAPTPAPKAEEKPAVAAPAPVAEVVVPAPAPVQTAKVIPLTLSDSLMDLPKTAPAPTIVNKVAASPAPAAAPAPAATTPAPAVKAEVAAPAPAKAAAPAVAVHTGVSCDGCGAKPITGIRYNCITCANFDLCAKCESDPKKHPVTHAMLKIRQPIDYSALHKSSAATTKPTNSGTAAPATAAKPAPKAEFKAEYVSDVTIPDGSKVSPGASLHKVWKVKNFGAAPWPAGTALAFVGGEVAPSQPQPTDLVSVPTAKPGECVDVGLYLRMPEKAGRHTGYYRLQLPANASSTGAAQQFGSRMWVDVLVVPPQEMPNAPAPDVTVFATAVIPPALAPNAAATPSADAKATPAPAPAPVAAKQNAPAPAAPAPAPAPVSNYKYARELEELNAMGFTDKELVMYLLSNNSGDVGRVVNWMLQNAH